MKKPILPDNIYEILKWLSCIALDAVGLLYKGLAEIWGWPYGDAVLATCSVVATFIGALIGVSTYQYRKQQGAIDMQPEESEIDGKE